MSCPNEDEVSRSGVKTPFKMIVETAIPEGK
jgi:hypothetical protein